MSIYVDAASNLVSKHETLYVDPLTAEDAAEVEYRDYAGSGKQRLPRAWIDREAGQLVANFRVESEIDPTITDAAFAPSHPDYVVIDGPPVLTEEVEQLADGVFMLRHIAGRNQHALVVAFKDHVLLVEAQGSSAGGEKLIVRIKQLLPDKPIRYVAITHHHGDHIGGVRALIAEGATVITTPGNRRYIETFAKAPHFDRLRDQPRDVKFLFTETGRRALSDGSRTVELIDIGPNPHAREMLVAYLPKEGILFEADVFTRPYTSQPIGPKQALTVSFVERMRSLGLKVNKIVGAHGRTATAKEFSELTQLAL